mgnify:CR=1 FL=1
MISKSRARTVRDDTTVISLPSARYHTSAYPPSASASVSCWSSQNLNVGHTQLTIEPFTSHGRPSSSLALNLSPSTTGYSGVSGLRSTVGSSYRTVLLLSNHRTVSCTDPIQSEANIGWLTMNWIEGYTSSSTVRLGCAKERRGRARKDKICLKVNAVTASAATDYDGMSTDSSKIALPLGSWIIRIVAPSAPPETPWATNFDSPDCQVAFPLKSALS